MQPMRRVTLLVLALCLNACAPVELPTVPPLTATSPPASATATTATNVPGRTAQISEVLNQVTTRKTREVEFQPATEGDQLVVGGGVKTGEESRVRVDTSDGSIIRIAAFTEFQLLDFTIEPDNPVTRINLVAGKLWIMVTKALGLGAFEIETPAGVATVRGSLMSVEYDPATGQMTVTCLEGQCRLTGSSGPFTDLQAGEYSIITGMGLSPSPANAMSNLQLADWSGNFPEAAGAVAIVTAQPRSTSTVAIAAPKVLTPTPSTPGGGEPTATPGASRPAADCNLRSVSGTQAATITFINQSGRTVELKWLNYEGQEVSYGQLQPGESLAQPTYLTHPWCVRDSVTGEALLAYTTTAASQTVIIP